jgi:hypothetical protein
MVHVPKEKRRKLDRKSSKMIFVGYDEYRKGFRCMDQSTGRLTISRDVIFHEEQGNVRNTIQVNLDSEPEKQATEEPVNENAEEPDEENAELNESCFEDATDNDSEFEAPEIGAIPQTDRALRPKTRTRFSQFSPSLRRASDSEGDVRRRR